MEVVQNGMVKEDGIGELVGGFFVCFFICSFIYIKLSDLVVCGDCQLGDFFNGFVEDGVDSGFVVVDDILSWMDVLEVSSLLLFGVDCGIEEILLYSFFGLGFCFFVSNIYEKLLCGMEVGVQVSCMQECVIQIDFVQYQFDFDIILEKVIQVQVCGIDFELGDRCLELDVYFLGFRDFNLVVVVMVGDELEVLEFIICGFILQWFGVNFNFGQLVSVVCFVEEEEEVVIVEKEFKSYWSCYYIVDLLVVVVLVVFMVVWFCCFQWCYGQFIYNISFLLWGCCIVVLYFICRISCCLLSQFSFSLVGGGFQF